MMKKRFQLVSLTFVSSLIVGCSSEPLPLGQHVVAVKELQTFNPNASQDNLGYIPSGSGERMESAYQVYTGKQSEDLSSSDSQFIEGFSD